MIVTDASGGISTACGFSRVGWRATATALPIVISIVSPGRIFSSFLATSTVDDIGAESHSKRSTGSGRIDVLVNNAGIGVYDLPSTASVELTRRLFDLNVFERWPWRNWYSRHAGARPRDDRKYRLSSRILFPPLGPTWCASRVALHSVSEAMRRELLQNWISVVQVIPGIVETGSGRTSLYGVAPRRRQQPAQSSVRGRRCQGRHARNYETLPDRLRSPDRLFRLVEFLTPGIMDWYKERLLQGFSSQANKSHAAACARPVIGLRL